MIESVAQVRKRGHEHSAVNDLFPLRTISEESRDSATSLIAFIKEYYTYLNQERGPSRVLQDLYDQNDVDIVGDNFLDSIQAEIAKLVPTAAGRDRRTLYKRIVHFYRSKGTPESVNTFFRLFFPDYELPELKIDGDDPWTYMVSHATLSVNVWHNAFRQLVHPAGLNFIAAVEVLCAYSDADREDSDSFIPRYLAESFIGLGKRYTFGAEWDRGRKTPMLNGLTESRTDLTAHYPLHGSYIGDRGANPPDRYWNIQWSESDNPIIDNADARIAYDISGYRRHGAMHDPGDSTFVLGDDGVGDFFEFAENSGIYFPLALNDFRIQMDENESDMGIVYQEAYDDLGQDNPFILPTDEAWSITFWYRGTGANGTSDALVDNFGTLVGHQLNGSGNLYDSDDSGYWAGTLGLVYGGQLGVLADDEAPGEGKLTYQFASRVRYAAPDPVLGGVGYTVPQRPQAKSTTSIDDNEWHHCAMVNHANETVDLYVDGVKEVDAHRNDMHIMAGNTRAYFVASSLLNGWIGYDSDEDTRYDSGATYGTDKNPSGTSGSIIDYRVYSNDLAPTEILELYTPNNSRHQVDFGKAFSVKATHDEYLAYGSRQRHPLVQNKWVNETKFTDLASIGTFSNVKISDGDLNYRTRRDITTGTGTRRNFLRNWNASASITSSLDSDSDGAAELTGYNTRRDRNVLDVRITSAQFSTFSPGEPFEYQIQTSYSEHEIASYSFSANDEADATEITSKLTFNTATGKLSTTKWNLVREVVAGSLTEEERQAYKAAFDGAEPNETGTTYKLVDDAINFAVHVKATNGRTASLPVRIINTKLAPKIRSIKIINGSGRGITGITRAELYGAGGYGFAKPTWVNGDRFNIHRTANGQFASNNGWHEASLRGGVGRQHGKADVTTYDFYTYDETTKAATWTGDYPVSAYALQGSDRASFPYNFIATAPYASGDWASITQAEWEAYYTKVVRYARSGWRRPSDDRLYVNGKITTGIPYLDAVGGNTDVIKAAIGKVYNEQRYVPIQYPGVTLSPPAAWEAINNIEDKSKLIYQQVIRDAYVATNKLRFISARQATGPHPAAAFDTKARNGLLHDVKPINLGLPSNPVPVFGQNSHLEFVVNTTTGVEDINDLGSKEHVTIESIGIWTGNASPGPDPEQPDFSGIGGSYIGAAAFGSGNVYPFNSIENGEVSLKPRVNVAVRGTGGVSELTYSIYGKRFMAAGTSVRSAEDIDGNIIDVVAPGYHGISLYGTGGVKVPTNLAGEKNKFPIAKSRQYRERVHSGILGFLPTNGKYSRSNRVGSVGVYVSDMYTMHDGLSVDPPDFEGFNDAWYQWVNKTRFPNKATDARRGITFSDDHFEGALTSVEYGQVDSVRNYYNIPTTAGGSIGEFTVATEATAATVLNGLPGSGAATSYEGWKITVANEFGAVSKNVFLKYDPAVTKSPITGNPFQSFLPRPVLGRITERTDESIYAPLSRINGRVAGAAAPKELPFQTIGEISEGYENPV